MNPLRTALDRGLLSIRGVDRSLRCLGRRHMPPTTASYLIGRHNGIPAKLVGQYGP
jgi:hypothetical protein